MKLNNFKPKNYKTKGKKSIIDLYSRFSNFIINNSFYDLKLNGATEIKVVKDNKIFYYIIVVNTPERQNLFCIYLYCYYLLTKANEKLYLPIDFEFNSRVIALMQLNFETNFNNRFIFVLYPPILSRYCLSILIKKILGNKLILKILHGSDSLDMPYLLTELIQRRKYQKKFIYSFIDTRYFCEFYNYQKNYDNKKCKIYTVLLDKGIITKQKLNELYKNEEDMGPIYNITINVYDLSKELLLYTVYDVLFLKYLYLSYPIEKMEYKILIPDLTRLVFLERRGITHNYVDIAILNNDMNNYFIQVNKSKIKLVDIFNKIISSISIPEYYLKDLLKINYFKKWLNIIIKYILYSILSKKYDIFQKNNIKIQDNLNIQKIFIKNKKYGKIINKLINSIINKVNKENY